MARLYSRRRGRSGSTRPVAKKMPTWVKYTPGEVEDLVLKTAREGHQPSDIGQILRDRYTIPLVKTVLGRSIGEVLRQAGEAPKVPQDLQSLLEKANRMRRYFEKNRKDFHNRRSLALIESKIYRLSKFYRRVGTLPKDWKYAPVAASIK